MSRRQNFRLQSAKGATQATDPVGEDFEVPRDAGVHGALYLDCTVLSGTNETLDVTVYAKDPLSGKYHLIATFTQLTAVGQQRLITGVAIMPDTIIRSQAAIGGTGVLCDFSVSISLA